MKSLDILINNFLNSLGLWGPLVGSILIIFESIIPILPLFVFITLNFLAFGNIFGFIISWICTCIGCFLSFTLFRNKIQTIFYKKIKEQGIISTKTMNTISNLRFEQLVTLIAIPFTPAFLINIACGLSKMSTKKFMLAIIIGKIFLVYFWGFVGVSLIDSIKHPIYLVKVLILMLIAYILSKVINKKYKIE